MIRPWRSRFVSCSLIVAVVLTALSGPVSSAQQPFRHLNPVIEKLSQGKHVFGVSTSDLSMQNARALAREGDIDYVYLDMEHAAMRFDQIETFLAGMIDPAGIVKRGNTQMRPAVFARFPPTQGQELWIIKHTLDLGLMGILTPRTETKEQAEQVVRTMRPAQRRDSKIPNPPGLRETGGLGPWFWGISGEQYFQRSDLWPLNPQGDLIYWPMIETRLGVQNADEIAQVPGVGGFYLGSAGDLSRSYGAPSSADPEVEQALQSILKVCKVRNIPCGGTVSAANAEGRIKDGYRIVNFGGANGGLSVANGAAQRAALAAGAQR